MPYEFISDLNSWLYILSFNVVILLSARLLISIMDANKIVMHTWASD